MNIFFNSLSTNNSPSFNDYSLPLLTPLQKKTIAIAAAVFTCLALAYVLMQRFYFKEGNQTENQEKEPGKTPEIAKNILTSKHSPKSEELVQVEGELKIDVEMIVCDSKKSNILSKEDLVHPFIQGQDKPIDLKLSDAALQDLLRKHGDKLKCLNLGNRRIDDNQLLEFIGYCPNLQQLFIKSDKISDKGLEHLSKLAALQELRLEGCDQITDAGLEHLSKLAALQKLDLTGCKKIGDDGLEHLSKLAALRELNLEGCDQIGDTGLEHLSKLAALQELNLAKCGQIGDAGLEHLSKL